MNLVYGTIVEIGSEDGIRVGTVRISGVLKKVPLDLIGEAQCGQQILLCDHVAIGKVAEASAPVNSEGVH